MHDMSETLREYRMKFEAIPAGKRANPPDGDNLGMRSKLGGSPDWIQADNTPVCEFCKRPMTFVAQIDSIEHDDVRNPQRKSPPEQEFMFADVGMFYLFWCRRCGSHQSIFQT
jgi:hypothetical protein